MYVQLQQSDDVCGLDWLQHGRGLGGVQEDLQPNGPAAMFGADTEPLADTPPAGGTYPLHYPPTCVDCPLHLTCIYFLGD